MAEKKQRTGRPTKYKAEYCDLVIELGEKGATKYEMADACGIHHSLLPVWTEKHPAFLEALKIADQKARIWWEKTGRENVGNNKFNSPLWHKMMGGRWKKDYAVHKIEHSGPGGDSIPVRFETVYETAIDEEEG